MRLFMHYSFIEYICIFIYIIKGESGWGQAGWSAGEGRPGGGWPPGDDQCGEKPFQW